MTDEQDLITCVQRYRASVEEVSESSLDQMIMQAAARQAFRRRLARRAGGAGVLTAVTMLCAAVAWYAHQPRPSRAIVTNYGQIEGSTRAYLLRAGRPELTRPGFEEGKP